MCRIHKQGKGGGKWEDGRDKIIVWVIFIFIIYVYNDCLIFAEIEFGIFYV